MAVPKARWTMYNAVGAPVDLSPYTLAWHLHVGCSYDENSGAWSIVSMSGRIVLDNSGDQFTLDHPNAVLSVDDVNQLRPALLHIGADLWAVAQLAPALSVPMRADDTIVFEIMPRFQTYLRSTMRWIQRFSATPELALAVATEAITDVSGTPSILSPASRGTTGQYLFGVRINESTMLRGLENLAWAAGSIASMTLNGQIALVAGDKAIRLGDLDPPPPRVPEDSSHAQTIGIRQAWVHDIVGPTLDNGSLFNVDIPLEHPASSPITRGYMYEYPDDAYRIRWHDGETIIGGAAGVHVNWRRIVPAARDGKQRDLIYWNYISADVGGPTRVMRLTGTKYVLDDQISVPIWAATREPGRYQPHQEPPPWTDHRTPPAPHSPNDLRAHHGMARITGGLLTRFVLTYMLVDDGPNRIIGDNTRLSGALVPGTGGLYRISDTQLAPLLTETISLEGDTETAVTLHVTALGLGAAPVTTAGTYTPPVIADLPNPSDNPPPGPPPGPPPVPPLIYVADPTKDIALGSGDWFGGPADGTTVWFVNDITDTAVAYTAATLARDATKDIALGSGTWYGSVSDGVTVWFVAFDGTVVAYTAATLARDATKDIALGSGNWFGAVSDGTTVWFVNDTTDTAVAYTAATLARDATKDIALGSGTWFGGPADGTTVWFVNDITDTAVAYTAATLARDATKDIALGSGTWYGAVSDGTTLWFVNDTTDTAVAYIPHVDG